jgi:hypothetical protein
MEQSQSPVPALGPNARSRLAWLAGIVGGLLVIAGLIHYVTGIGNSATQHQPRASVTGSGISSPQQQQRDYGAMDLGIPYGATPKQVLRQLGSPTTKQADCWLYRGPEKLHGPYLSPYVDAMKFCFAEGPAGGKAVSDIYNHTVAHTIKWHDEKRRYPAQWSRPIALAKVPDWYLQENS